MIQTIRTKICWSSSKMCLVRRLSNNLQAYTQPKPIAISITVLRSVVRNVTFCYSITRNGIFPSTLPLRIISYFLDTNCKFFQFNTQKKEYLLFPLFCSQNSQYCIFLAGIRLISSLFNKRYLQSTFFHCRRPFCVYIHLDFWYIHVCSIYRLH